MPPAAAAAAEVQAGPHCALFLVLGYLRLPDLLTFQRVCRPLRDAVAGDALLWRHLTVEPPLSAKLTDDTLLQITSRAEGKLKSLALFECRRITDGGLLRVVEQNPGITKLYIPGCTYLTADGVVKVVKRLHECKGNLNWLRLHGLCNITKDHLNILNSFLCTSNFQQVPKQSLYKYGSFVASNSDDGRPIDVDMCPRCRNVRLVFDCTRENCRMKNYTTAECRGCLFCIARCEGCGGCLALEELVENQTACSHLLCAECWLQLPKCNTCNRPYCRGQAGCVEVPPPGPGGYVCQLCMDLETRLYVPEPGY